MSLGGRLAQGFPAFLCEQNTSAAIFKIGAQLRRLVRERLRKSRARAALGIKRLELTSKYHGATG